MIKNKAVLTIILQIFAAIVKKLPTFGIMKI